MTLNTLKCNHLMPWHFKGLNDGSLNWNGCVTAGSAILSKISRGQGCQQTKYGQEGRGMYVCLLVNFVWLLAGILSSCFNCSCHYKLCVSRLFNVQRWAGAFDTVSEAGRLQVLTRWNEICRLFGGHCCHRNALHTGADGEFVLCLYLFSSCLGSGAVRIGHTPFPDRRS